MSSEPNTLQEKIHAYLIETGQWTHVPGAELAWIDHRRVSQGDKRAVTTGIAVASQLVYEAEDAE